jgi:hypothetical protein
MMSTDFLREYFCGTEGRVYLGALRNPKSTLGRGEVAKLVTRNSTDIAKFIAEHDKPEREVGIYYCTATLLDGHTTREAGSCRQFPSLFADCDDHNHELNRGRVIELLEALECPPTMIVDSGHGLQPHWLLSEPSEDAERIIAARKKLQAILASDAVHDAPRYMRLPGSHNSKGGDWLLVEVVVHHPERRYTLEVLEGMLDTAAVVIPRKAKATKGNGAASDKPFIVPPSSAATDHKRGAAWARKALEESARELANAQPGARHGMLLKKANRMATMVARGWIDSLEVQHALFAAAEACGEIKEYGIEHFNKTSRMGSSTAWQCRIPICRMMHRQRTTSQRTDTTATSKKRRHWRQDKNRPRHRGSSSNQATSLSPDLSRPNTSWLASCNAASSIRTPGRPAEARRRPHCGSQQVPPWE